MKEKMTNDERRKRAEHHVVHDYANLLSSGLLKTDDNYMARLLNIPTANSHVWHAFYINCRKMYEFFTYQQSKKYLTAQQFIKPRVTFTFLHWTADVQDFMNVHMLHVGGSRVTNKKVSTGADDMAYLAEFQGMWGKMLRNLEDKHKPIFCDEIDFRLSVADLKFCGSLGKEFIL